MCLHAEGHIDIQSGRDQSHSNEKPVRDRPGSVSHPQRNKRA